MEIQGDYNTADVKTDSFDENCRQQIQEMTDHPAFEGENSIKVMPDTHYGAGAVIGFTMPFTDKVSPNTIGVDIGCGMYAFTLKNQELDLSKEENLEKLDNLIRDKIPMGFNVHDRSDYHMEKDFPWRKCQRKLEKFNENSSYNIDHDYSIEYFKELLEKIEYETGRAINSVGTLGGGNHFIEIGESVEEESTWTVIHSGSRGVGASIAKYWQAQATQLRTVQKMKSVSDNWMNTDINGETVDLHNYVKFDADSTGQEILDWLNGAKGESYKKRDKIEEDFVKEEIAQVHKELRCIHKTRVEDRNTDLDYLEKEEAEGYIVDMIFAQTFASESRRVMGFKVEEAFREAGAEDVINMANIESVHNYIDFEDQIIRKGACSAKENELIVIPFNMKYGTLIAEGKGMSSWNQSAPHGAGRAMSRTKAHQKYSVEDMMDQTGGVYMSKKPVDETPKAYKDPGMVEDAVGETAEVVDRIKPVLSIKAE